MRKLKIYLDTSIINFVEAKDAPEKEAVTHEFLDKFIHLYDVYYSDIVVFEINRTKEDARKSFLLNILRKYDFNTIEIESKFNEIESLASLYIEHGIIPQKKREDALHIAICTVFEFDILLSWNFQHLANINKQIRINTVNAEQGYLKTLNLLTPYEVIYEN